MGEIVTFGAMIKFALELEHTAQRFYQEAAGEKHWQHAQTFSSFATECAKREASLERLRRENVNEILLEPIVGLEEGDYRISPDLARVTTFSQVIGHALEMEEKICHFYTDSASKAKSILAEASRIFEKLASQNATRKEKLKSLSVDF